MSLEHENYMRGVQAMLAGSGLEHVFSEATLSSVVTILQGACEGTTPQVQAAIKELSPELRPMIINILDGMRRNIGSVLHAVQNPELMN